MISRRNLIGAALGAPLLATIPAFAAAPQDMAAFIAGLPKAEYHVHLEGTLEAEMKFALAQRNGLALPFADVAAMKQSYKYHDLPSFLAIYYDGMKVLLKEQDFYDLAYAYLAKAASQNILYAEMFFDPQSHTGRGVPIDTVILGIARAQADAQKALGIESQLILCFMRDLSAESAMATLQSALPFKKYLVGVGLDSDEEGNPPGKFAAAFALARAEGLKITAHCDVNQTDTLANIRYVIDTLKADRVDHGGNILQSPELIAMAKSRNLYFTVCPTFSGIVRSGDRSTEIVRGMIDQGLNVTINSDDPAYMGSEYLNEVMVKAQVQNRLTKRELIQIERNAFNAGWMLPEQRDAFLGKLDAYARRSGVS
jgi:adenosine deaminase